MFGGRELLFGDLLAAQKTSRCSLGIRSVQAKMIEGLSP